MFKRKHEEEVAPSEEKQSPIPRVMIPENVIPLRFVQRGFYEFAPGKLYYPLICQTIKYMFDDAYKNQLAKFSALNYGFTISTPKLRISNLIMLQDDLRVQSSTPTDATAFTQVNYLLEYMPRGQKQFFKLCKGENQGIDNLEDLTYQFNPTYPSNPFVEIKGFETFDDLCIIPAKANTRAGFTPGEPIRIGVNTGTLLNPYVAPNTNTEGFQYVSGNLNPPNTNEVFYKGGNVITRAINQDKINEYKYGDTINFSPETNLEGILLANTTDNDFIYNTTVNLPNATAPDQTLVYDTEWCWPGRNRPFFCRQNYYDPNTDPITKGKKFKPLKHVFYMMPPIKKPNGSLLGQRCSVMTEQEVTVTFHYTTNVWGENLDNENMFDQDNKVILRRNIYPTPTIVKPEESSYLCRAGSSICPVFAPGVARAGDCYEDSPYGITAFLDEIEFVKNRWNSYCEFKTVDSKPEHAISFPGDRIITIEVDKATGQDLDAVIFFAAWRAANAAGRNIIQIYYTSEMQIDYGQVSLLDSSTVPKEGFDLIQCLDKKKNLIEFNYKNWLDLEFFPRTSNKCSIKSTRKNAPVNNPDVTVFFV